MLDKGSWINGVRHVAQQHSLRWRPREEVIRGDHTNHVYMLLCCLALLEAIDERTANSVDDRFIFERYGKRILKDE